MTLVGRAKYIAYSMEREFVLRYMTRAELEMMPCKALELLCDKVDVGGRHLMFQVWYHADIDLAVVGAPLVATHTYIHTRV